MFITPAYAQSSMSGSDVSTLILPLVFILIFYLLVFRPQQQRMKQHREMIANIKRGDTVITSSGIIGKVVRVKDDAEVEVVIADNTRVRMIKAMIADVRAKGEPVKDASTS